ncbi:MAG: hypothetical protein GEV00_21635 [Actinophytocola sp.]|nr:hypothetical protein [Actinophytocola sp.]
MVQMLGAGVRTYNMASAKLFWVERMRDLAKLEAHRRRSHEFRRRAGQKARALFASRERQ